MMLNAILLPLATAKSGLAYCSRGDSSCWPTADEVQALSDSLNPEMERTIHWDGKGNPWPTGIPYSIPQQDQPLYGFAKDKSMEPVYSTPDSSECFTNATNWPYSETRDSCYVSIRNNAFWGNVPGFIVWALNADHVQKAVKFAVKHNLCVAVAGTGHDFMSRHQCKDGIFIRTTLIKGMDFDENDDRGFGWAGGNVRAGAGIGFSEVHKEAADRGLFVSSGWASSVGIAGWTLGGGHGPFANYAGIGVDNLLEAQIVLADGSLVRANSTHYSDLYWALRGGGGSTWGVITEFTLRTHKLPEDGITYVAGEVTGDYCTWKFWSNGKNYRNKVIEAYLDWTLTLGSKWSGMAFITPSESNSYNCGAEWSLGVQYWYVGSAAEADSDIVALNDAMNGAAYSWGNLTTQYNTFWEHLVDQGLEPIIPTMWATVGVPSVLVGRDKVSDGRLAKQIQDRLDDTVELENWARQELYNDLTGNVGAVQEPLDNVAISTELRTAMFHFVFGSWTDELDETYYSLGDNSYMSESKITMDDWPARLWGNEVYAKLLDVKQKYDPNGVFWCYHCVGDDDGREDRLSELPSVAKSRKTLADSGFPKFPAHAAHNPFGERFSDDEIASLPGNGPGKAVQPTTGRAE